MLRVIESPRRCSYLPAERASLEYRGVASLDARTYSDLLSRGYRRFGHQLYRPACRSCSRCVSVRVLAGEFSPSRSQRRVLRRNRHIRVVRRPVSISAEHLALFERYHRYMAAHRGWPSESPSVESYEQSFLLGGGGLAYEWLFLDGDKLAGVSLMDETSEAISLVYSFHDPDWRPAGAGTFAILTQLAYARRRKLPYAYLGYWVDGNSSMSYKANFRPREILTAYPADKEVPKWERASGSVLCPRRSIRERKFLSGRPGQPRNRALTGQSPAGEGEAAR